MGSYDVIVVGLGAMGSSAALHLASRGLRVLGIEQFTPAHAFGSSHGTSRIVRQAYFEKPDYVPLLQRSYQLWDELSATFGEQLLVRCGALMIGPPDSEVVAGTLASARTWSLPHEVLDAATMRRRFPQFALPADHIAVFEANAGYARAEPSVLANIELAIDAGAELWFDTEIESVQLGPEGVHVQAADSELTAPRAVIATGAWANRLANLDQFPLRASRQTVHWYTPADGSPEEFADLPVYLWQWPAEGEQPGAELYGFPYLRGDRGIKASLYRSISSADQSVDPDTVDRSVAAADAARLDELLARCIPSLAGPRVRGSVCLYASVPDDDFVLGLHPGSSGRVVLAVGFSGHGFKFMPVVGEIVADLVIDGRTDHEIGFLSPDRLTGLPPAAR